MPSEKYLTTANLLRLRRRFWLRRAPVAVTILVYAWALYMCLSNDQHAVGQSMIWNNIEIAAITGTFMVFFALGLWAAFAIRMVRAGESELVGLSFGGLDCQTAYGWSGPIPVFVEQFSFKLEAATGRVTSDLTGQTYEDGRTAYRAARNY